MAWTTPHAWIPGEVATAALLNANLRDNFQYLYDGRPAFLFTNGTIGVSGGTTGAAISPVTFTTDSAGEAFDQGMNFTPPGGSIALPEIGYWFLHGFMGCNNTQVAAANTVRVLYAYPGSAAVTLSEQSGASTASALGPSIGTSIIHLCGQAAASAGTVSIGHTHGGTFTGTVWFQAAGALLRSP